MLPLLLRHADVSDHASTAALEFALKRKTGAFRNCLRKVAANPQDAAKHARDLGRIAVAALVSSRAALFECFLLPVAWRALGITDVVDAERARCVVRGFCGALEETEARAFEDLQLHMEKLFDGEDPPAQLMKIGEEVLSLVQRSTPGVLLELFVTESARACIHYSVSGHRYISSNMLAEQSWRSHFGCQNSLRKCLQCVYGCNFCVFMIARVQKPVLRVFSGTPCRPQGAGRREGHSCGKRGGPLRLGRDSAAQGQGGRGERERSQ